MVYVIKSNVTHVNYVIGLIINIFLTISTILLNSVTILAYTRSSLLKSKKSYFLIMLLSVVDLLVGLLANGSFVFFLVNVITGHPKCEVYNFFYYACYLLISMSTTTLFGINIERYLSILHPFYHRTEVTKSKLLKMIVGFWFVVIMLRLPSLFLRKTLKIISSVLFLLIALLTLYIYVAIFITVRKRPEVTKTRRIEERIREARIEEERTIKKEQLQNIKMAKSCAIVVALVFTCNVPMAIAKFVPDSNHLPLLSLWSGTIVLSASSMNSLAFFWKNLLLRKEAKQLFKNLNQQQNWKILRVRKTFVASDSISRTAFAKAISIMKKFMTNFFM